MEVGTEEILFAGKEFIGCKFNDKRLSSRVITMAKSIYERPGSKIFSVFSTNAEKKSAYNFFSNNKINKMAIQEPHMLKTQQKIKTTNEDVLLIQDTTYCSLDLVKPFENTNSYLGKTSDGKLLRGFALHNALAITASGVPMGLIKQDIYQHISDAEDEDERNLPIEDKESYRWLSVLKFAEENDFGRNVIHVCDREGDIFEVLSYAQKHNHKFIIRVCQDRRTGENSRKSDGKISEHLEKINAEYQEEIDIYDKEQGKYVKRKIAIKYKEVSIPRPQNKILLNKDDYANLVKINVVEAKSIDELVEIKWVLYTNLPVLCEKDADKIIAYYKLRWHVENYHKTLKTGFKIKEARLESANGLENLFAMLSILAFTLYYFIHIGRTNPDMSSSELLEKHEWQALLIKNKKANIADLEKIKAPTMGEALIMIAKIGGYMNRKKDGPPGILLIWRGWCRLSEIADYHKLICGEKTYG